MIRDVSYRVAVLRKGGEVSALSWAAGNDPTVYFDASGEIKSSFSGEFYVNPIVDLLSDEIQPILTVDGTEYPQDATSLTISSLTDSEVELLDYLLPEGDLFRSVSYDGKEEVDTSDADFLDMPMAVLVNGNTYSAAEFFAAALQEYEAAVVVGEPTVGKGYYQQTIPLGDGSAVALSTGKYFTPKGNSLAGKGITPTVRVDVDEETAAAIYYGTSKPAEDPQLQAAIKALK